MMKFDSNSDIYDVKSVSKVNDKSVPCMACHPMPCHTIP